MNGLSMRSAFRAACRVASSRPLQVRQSSSAVSSAGDLDNILDDYFDYHPYKAWGPKKATIRGEVAWWDDKKDFGYIRRLDGMCFFVDGPEVRHCMRTATGNSALRKLEADARVWFDVVDGGVGPVAANVHVDSPPEHIMWLAIDTHEDLDPMDSLREQPKPTGEAEMPEVGDPAFENVGLPMERTKQLKKHPEI